MLEVHCVSAGYGEMNIIHEVCMEVKQGEIVALIGANGVGKSTLLKTIAGLVRATKGKILLNGTDITKRRADEIKTLGFSLVPEGRRLFSEMTVYENLLVGAHLRKEKGIVHDAEHYMEFFPALRNRANQLAGNLSGGEQQMCSIARGLMSRPRLLAIDELSLGLAPAVVDELIGMLLRLRDEGTGVLLVEQDVEVALQVSDRAYVMERGFIVKGGHSKQLRYDPYIKEAYLGLGV